MDLTSLDWVAEGAMLRAMARKATNDQGWLSVRIRYRRPYGSLILDHDFDCVVAHYKIRAMIARTMRHPPPAWGDTRPAWMVVDFVRGWSFNGRMRRSVDAWIRRTKIARRTVIRWRRQTHEILNDWLALAEADIANEAHARGIIE